VQQVTICVGTAVGCVSILLTWLLVGSIVRPLRKLIGTVDRLIAGDETIRADERDDLHLGGLASAFNEFLRWIVTQRQQLAESNQKLEQNNRDLETTVAHRTTQLEVAATRLQTEIAEKEDFLRAVSHDLNAPLRNIGGMVAMLLMKQKDLPADVLQRLERIKKNVEVETDLINELLELSRIKTRRQTFDKVDLEGLIWELRGLFENDLKTRAIELTLDTTLPVLWAERARVRQVFQNLIDNAIKYMGDRPTREIHLGCRMDVSEIEFWVRDTGMGIHPDDIDKVFFVFRRGRGEAAKVAGKGVGLASVKSIIETYNGRIWVESKLGEGTTFRFTINGRYVPSIMPSGMALLTQRGDQDDDAGQQSQGDCETTAGTTAGVDQSATAVDPPVRHTSGAASPITMPPSIVSAAA
jgi:signal transduction histidine kinase